MMSAATNDASLQRKVTASLPRFVDADRRNRGAVEHLEKRPRKRPLFLALLQLHACSCSIRVSGAAAAATT